MIIEGFDNPRLKIAAFHRNYKSIPITLQFIGRLTRADETLGQGTVITNSDNMNHLLDESQDWGEVIPTLYEILIEEEKQIREQLQRLEDISPLFYGLSDVPKRAIEPNFHVKVFETQESVNIPRITKLTGRTSIRQMISDDNSHCVILAERREIPRWLKSSTSVYDIKYDLIVVYRTSFIEDKNYILINSSCKTDSLYKEIVELLVEPDNYNTIPVSRINKVLLDLESIRFFNIGLRHQVKNNRTESYRIISGTNVDRAITKSDGLSYNRGHIYCTYYTLVTML